MKASAQAREFVAALALLLPQTARAVDSAPPRAYSVGAAYDPRRECLVVFGGQRPGGVPSGETWSWDKSGWRRIDAPGPAARNAPAMAFDEHRGTILLFGGDDRAGPKGDTWEWNGVAWTRVDAQGAGPAPRTSARLAYDAKRGTTILFGGFAGQTVFGDAWELDGKTWKLVAADGPPRFLHGFVVDAEHGSWMTYGGSATAPTNGPPPCVGETWLFDGQAWKQWTGKGPGARDHVTLAFDAARARTLLYGGFVEGEPSAETWEWDGQAWTPMLARGGPGNRGNPSLVFDPQRRRVLLFGGFDASGPYNDLWEWDGKEWVRIG